MSNYKSLDARLNELDDAKDHIEGTLERIATEDRAFLCEIYLRALHEVTTQREMMFNLISSLE